MSNDIARRGAIAAQQKVPNTPQNVVATAGDTEAHLVWEAPESVGTSAVNNYEVTVTPSTGVTGATVRYVGSGVTGYTFTGLTNGVAYAFTVKAMNAIGSGPSSAISNSVTPEIIPAPDTPTNLAINVSDGVATHSFDEMPHTTLYRIETELVE